MESYNEFHIVIIGYNKEHWIILLITSDDFGLRDKVEKSKILTMLVDGTFRHFNSSICFGNLLSLIDSVNMIHNINIGIVGCLHLHFHQQTKTITSRLH